MVDLALFDNRDYHPGRPLGVQALWFFAGLPLLRSPVLPGSGFRRRLLHWFGATVGKGVVIKPGVRVKYPWRLAVGDYSWLGEDLWIDNIAEVAIGPHVCLSQGAYLCTGNHDWSDRAFGLRAAPIRIEEGAWVGAKAVVGPGVTVRRHGVLTAGSVAARDVAEGEIHTGNPAVFVKNRRFRGEAATLEGTPRG